jgi:hypothetical protein
MNTSRYMGYATSKEMNETIFGKTKRSELLKTWAFRKANVKSTARRRGLKEWIERRR